MARLEYTSRQKKTKSPTSCRQYSPREELKEMHWIDDLKLAARLNWTQQVQNGNMRKLISCKTDKAMRLFEHAAIIAPQNPDVLNHYGEFIEHMRNDTIVADELYSKALVYSPDHKAPLINRKRTAYVVNKLDLEIFKIIGEKRDLLKMKQKSSPNYAFMKLHAYYLHTYHTVGIEGNTLSVD
ncbi:hypothetical protein FQA39_LY10181 [Lamprigera yunnana]|nr:hypothetical protein FQA39_LY10181 [Lamprigera yunnana]